MGILSLLLTLCSIVVVVHILLDLKEYYGVLPAVVGFFIPIIPLVYLLFAYKGNYKKHCVIFFLVGGLISAQIDNFKNNPTPEAQRETATVEGNKSLDQ